MAFSAPASRRRAVVPFHALRAARSPPRQVAQRSLGDFERLPGLRLARPAAQRSTGAGGRTSSLEYATAATPSPLATARADDALTFRLRIRSASARGNTCLRRRARPAPLSRGGRRWKGLRRLRAAPTHAAPRRRPRCARAPAQTAGPRCASPAGGTPAAMRCAGGTAAEAPETRRAGLGDSFPNLAQCRQRTGGSLGGVLNVRGRPAVCKRRLVAAARGPQTTPGGVGRLRTNGAAVWRALGQFGTAVAAGGHGGRAAASGGKHTCVCRRIRCPFLVFRTHTSWLSKRYLSPPSQGRPLPKDHAASTRAAPAPFDTAINAGFWI